MVYPNKKTVISTMVSRSIYYPVDCLSLVKSPSLIYGIALDMWRRCSKTEFYYPNWKLITFFLRQVMCPDSFMSTPNDIWATFSYANSCVPMPEHFTHQITYWKPRLPFCSRNFEINLVEPNQLCSVSNVTKFQQYKYRHFVVKCKKYISCILQIWAWLFIHCKYRLAIATQTMSTFNTTRTNAWSELIISSWNDTLTDSATFFHQCLIHWQSLHWQMCFSDTYHVL